MCVMRQQNRNGLPDQGVCDGGHTVHSDKLCAMSQDNRNSSSEQDVCDMRQSGP